MERERASNRARVSEAIAEHLKQIDGTGSYLTNLSGNVKPRLQFWDEIDDFPAVNISAGTETREYNGGNFRWRDLNLIIRCYVRQEDNPLEELELLMQDVEAALETPLPIVYRDTRGNPQSIVQITLLSMTTDEGVMAPLAVGEIAILVRY